MVPAVHLIHFDSLGEKLIFVPKGVLMGMVSSTSVGNPESLLMIFDLTMILFTIVPSGVCVDTTE
jgi:hypothetical protein